MNEFIQNIDKIHTTPMGMERVAKNLETDAAAAWMMVSDVVRRGDAMRRGKNYYVTNGAITVTINACTFTVITAHKNL